MRIWSNSLVLVRARSVGDLGQILGEIPVLLRDRPLAAIEKDTTLRVAEGIRSVIGAFTDRLRVFPLLSALASPDLEWRQSWRSLREDEYLRLDGQVVRVEDLAVGAEGVFADLVAGEWISR